MVDDASERDFLGKELEDYIAALSVPVYLYRTGERSGLIRARLLGAQHAKVIKVVFSNINLQKC